MKSLWHNFHTVLIISQDFTNWFRFEISGNFFTGRFQYFLFKYFKELQFAKKTVKTFAVVRFKVILCLLYSYCLSLYQYHDYCFTTVKESTVGTLANHFTKLFPLTQYSCSYNLAELLYKNWYYKKLYTAKIIQQQSELIVEKHMNYICKSKGKPQEAYVMLV